MTDIVEQAARVLAENWQNMHTNESLGKQQMLAQALADAGLLRDGPIFPINDDPEMWEKYRQACEDVYETAAQRIGTGETWTVDAREALGLTRTVPTRKQIAEAVSDIDAKSWPNPASTEEIADVILELLADQPTVAEVKAQALEEFAAHIENTAQRDDVRLTEHAVNDTGGAYLARERAQQIRDGK